MKETLALANRLATRLGGPTDTGYLMLALVSGDHSAGHLLRHFGLTESKIRYQLRTRGAEPSALYKAVARMARQIEKPGEFRKPTPLHLLVALLNTPESNGVEMLNTLNVNISQLRSEALHCLTSTSGSQRAAHAAYTMPAGESGQALPLLGHLNVCLLTHGPPG